MTKERKDLDVLLKDILSNAEQAELVASGMGYLLSRPKEAREWLRKLGEAKKE